MGKEERRGTEGCPPKKVSDSVLRHAVVVLLAIARCLYMVQAGLL